jgi:phosphate transport system substrate-binding protein
MIVVNGENPVSNLTAEQVRAIMRGDITNWQVVGGRDEPIVLVTRLHCKKRPGHWKTILPDADEFRQQRLNVSSAADMVQRVSDFKGAIGHIGSTWDFAPDSKLKVVTVDGFEPSAENLASKRYPFFRNLSAVTNQHPSDDVLAIIKEVRTGAAFEHVARKYQLLRLDTYEPSQFP